MSRSSDVDQQKTATPPWSARFAQWRYELLLARADRQFELAMGLSLIILVTTAALAPIYVLQESSLISFVLIALIFVGHLRAPHWRAWWIFLLWAVWQGQASVGTYVQGGIWSPYVGYYFICSTSILISVGSRAATLSMCLTSLFIAGMTYLHTHQLIPPSSLPRDEWLWPTVSAAMLIVTLGTLPVVAYGGRVKSLRALNKDNDRLNEAQQKLQEHQIQQQQFVASVSHELRTPMNAIMGYLQSIDRHELKTPGELEHIEIMESSATQLLHRINELLDFSQLQANQLTLDHKPFDLSELIREVQARHVSEMERKQLKGWLDIDRRMPSQFWGDGPRLAQMIDIVLSNAVKFTSVGSVGIRAQALTNQRVRLTVVDTGQGILESEIEALFSHLAKPSEIKSRAFGGTGIGLSTAQALARLMDGSIQISSRLSRGTKVTIELNLESTGLQPIEQSLNSQWQDLEQLQGRLLIVDDSRINRMVARHLLLKRMPHLSINEAMTGEQALELALAWRPHVILMDIYLPDLSGIKASQVLLEASSDVQPIVFGLTADTSANLRREGLEAGMRDIIHKPFDADQVTRMITEALNEALSLDDPTPLQS